MQQKILIVDDDRKMRSALGGVLRGDGYLTIEASNGIEAIEITRTESPAAILMDLMMPGINGLETMTRIRKLHPDIPIIMVTGQADIPTAVKAMRQGAYDFIAKPLDIERFIVIVRKAIEKGELERELIRMHTAASTSLEWMLGRSAQTKKIIHQIQQVACTDFTIILEGETGVGKSFLARIIHSLSRRAEGPYISIDMAAIPETLVESELFGYEKGAFTGATTAKEGLLEKATGGTMLIDEMENMSQTVQTKFLSLIEERSIRTIGGKQKDIDIRFICATNRNLKKALAENRLRKDLYYRLNEFVVNVPPLRDRSEDIPFLAQKFLAEACADMQRPEKTFSEGVCTMMLQYPWPGNVRELRNVIRRTVLMSDEPSIEPADLDIILDDTKLPDENGASGELLPLKELSAMAVSAVEKKAVTRALTLTKWNKTKAAGMLQIDFKTLQAKIRDYDIQQP